MRLFRLFAVLLLLLAIGATTPIMAQAKGGRKREHRNQKSRGSLFHRKKSAGHADAFAKGRKKGFIAKLFRGKKNSGAWVYRKTNPGLKQNREQAQLFKRNRTKAKSYRDGILARQNKKRSESRVRGSSSFNKRKR